MQVLGQLGVDLLEVLVVDLSVLPGDVDGRALSEQHLVLLLVLGVLEEHVRLRQDDGEWDVDLGLGAELVVGPDYLAE